MSKQTSKHDIRVPLIAAGGTVVAAIISGLFLLAANNGDDSSTTPPDSGAATADSLSETADAEEPATPSTEPSETSTSTTSEPAADTPRPVPDALQIAFANVSRENYFPGGYTPDRFHDGDTRSYWSTLTGETTNVELTVGLAQPSDVTGLRFLADQPDSRYTQVESIAALMIDEGGLEVGRIELDLGAPDNGWKSFEFEPIENVDSIRLTLGQPINERSSYVTFNEIEVHGYTSAG